MRDSQTISRGMGNALPKKIGAPGLSFYEICIKTLQNMKKY
jgi:hypothetical protein